MSSYNVSKQCPVRFCGSTRRLYNVHYDVCTWAVMGIDDYDINEPNPLEGQGWKGLSLGLTCWDVLKYCTYDICDMNVVPLNGVYPYTITNDGSLCYDNYDDNGTPQSHFIFSTKSLPTPLTSIEHTEQTAQNIVDFQTTENCLKSIIIKHSPDIDLTGLNDISCQGLYSGQSFPSNVSNFMKLSLTSPTLTREICQTTCGRLKMIPSRLLTNIGLIFTLTFNSDNAKVKVVNVTIKLQLRDWVNPEFREYDCHQPLETSVNIV